MRTRSAWLWLTAAALSLSTLSCPACAEQRKADSQNDPQQIMRDLQKGSQSSQYVRDEPENLKVEDMTVEELRQRLSEFETGKRDDRDGYIIANQLWFDYQGRKETGTAEGQHARQILDQLKAKHPEFATLTDFNLSDRIRYQARDTAKKLQAKKEAKTWSPPDNIPVHVLINDRKAVGVFQFHLDFWNVPSDIEIKAKGTKFVFLKHGQEVNPSTFPLSKSLTFIHPVETTGPDYSDSIGPRFLACTMMLYDYYNAMNNEERKKTAILNGKRSLPWTNKNAKQEQICAVLSADGSTVFSFGTQHIPDTLFFPLQISADGKKAAVMVGAKVFEQGEDGTSPGVGNPREILEWMEGAGVKKIRVNDSSLSRFQVFRKYASGEFWKGKK